MYVYFRNLKYQHLNLFFTKLPEGRDHYSKNLTILNLSSYSVLNLPWDAKNPRTREMMTLFRGWEFHHENIKRAASNFDFWKRVTGKEGVKKWLGFPLLLFVILFKGLNLNFTTFVENSVWVFFYTKMCFIGLRSRASLSISALRGRRGGMLMPTALRPFL